MRKRLKMLPRRHNTEFEKFFKEHCILDEATGKITVRDCYAHLGFNISWSGKLISMTYSNAVWFLKYGKWPDPGNHIDHINDDALDNRPDNLQELTEAENQAKRRGRKVYRSYGKGKYGYGIYIHFDKRDGHYYISRNISRGFGKGDLNGVRIALGREDSLTEAQIRVKNYIKDIDKYGLDYVPPSVVQRPKKTTARYDAKAEEMRVLREQGMTFQKIADKFGVRMGVVYRRTRDVVVKT